ncbi:MAG TPA: hypothetical protein VKB39_03150 [Candidatus Baltobacteraceae bacterium]|nr:hypothetical protein [Candidatus Baltobacteraceae bacterium]
MVSPQGVPFSVAVEAMLLEPLLAPLFEHSDGAGQYEAGEFALEIAKQLGAPR